MAIVQDLAFPRGARDVTMVPADGGDTPSLSVDGLTDATVSSPATNQGLLYNGTAWVNTPLPHDVACFVAGKPDNSEVVLRYTAPRAFSLPSGAAGSYAVAGTAATSSQTLTLAKNGVSFGTIVFSAAGTTAAITIGTTTAFAAGDVLTITGAASADATLADIAITLAGTRA